jgi:hypothetical protein
MISNRELSKNKNDEVRDFIESFLNVIEIFLSDALIFLQFRNGENYHNIFIFEVHH